MRGISQFNNEYNSHIIHAYRETYVVFPSTTCFQISLLHTLSLHVFGSWLFIPGVRNQMSNISFKNNTNQFTSFFPRYFHQPHYACCYIHISLITCIYRFDADLSQNSSSATPSHLFHFAEKLFPRTKGGGSPILNDRNLGLPPWLLFC